MASEILQHPMSKARQAAGALETLEGEAQPPVLEGEVQPAVAEAPSPVLERLHALVRKGYRPEIGTDTTTDMILLRHIGKSPDLVLHSDGRVEGHDGRRPRFKREIDAPAPFAAGDLAEDLRFMRFLDSVPRPTLRDRTRRFRHRYVYFPLVMAILLAIHLAFTALIMDGDQPSRPPPAAPAEQAPAAVPIEQAPPAAPAEQAPAAVPIEQAPAAAAGTQPAAAQ